MKIRFFENFIYKSNSDPKYLEKNENSKLSKSKSKWKSLLQNSEYLDWNQQKKKKKSIMIFTPKHRLWVHTFRKIRTNMKKYCKPISLSKSFYRLSCIQIFVQIKAIKTQFYHCSPLFWEENATYSYFIQIFNK